MPFQPCNKEHLKRRTRRGGRPSKAEVARKLMEEEARLREADRRAAGLPERLLFKAVMQDIRRRVRSDRD